MKKVRALDIVSRLKSYSQIKTVTVKCQQTKKYNAHGKA